MDEKHEAELVISSIKESGKYADWAVLYRTNGQSRLIEESLIRKNIPYQVFGGMKFYERKEIKDILAYIRVVFNPYDMISMSRIINVPSRKIGETSIAKFRDILSTENMSIYDIAKNIDKLDSLPPAAQRSISGFLSLYLSMKDVCTTRTIHELMKYIVERI
jgi:DNA helicase-2/ATP-dependent DNA helicase PcrA